jgi:hypothetical protein
VAQSKTGAFRHLLLGADAAAKTDDQLLTEASEFLYDHLYMRGPSAAEASDGALTYSLDLLQALIPLHGFTEAIKTGMCRFRLPLVINGTVQTSPFLLC